MVPLAYIGVQAMCPQVVSPFDRGRFYPFPVQNIVIAYLRFAGYHIQ